MESYKRQQNICITNKKNQDQVFMKLHTKLLLDIFLNLDLVKIDLHEAIRNIFYLINFAKIQTELKFEDVLNIIRVEIDSFLLLLPLTSDLIDKDILKVISFTLLIKDK